MSKYGVLYVLIIMIVETIMYSVIVGFDSFIRDDEKPWYPSFDDSYYLILNRDACYKKCDQTYDKFSSSTSKPRWKRCRQVCRELEKLIENIWGTKEHNKKKRKEAIRDRG
ncbi:hypothetical protein AAHE18_02G194000 [Arachis hypogaea]|nr:uncharacterized protein DS421_12g384840 [Arachis hypogaea]